jgi:DNA integrity scanning protein DisA with diadenylate cyclase activity
MQKWGKMTNCIKTELQIAEIELHFAKAEIASSPERSEFVRRANGHIDAALIRLASLARHLEFSASVIKDV